MRRDKLVKLYTLQAFTSSGYQGPLIWLTVVLEKRDVIIKFIAVKPWCYVIETHEGKTGGFLPVSADSQFKC